MVLSRRNRQEYQCPDESNMKMAKICFCFLKRHRWNKISMQWTFFLAVSQVQFGFKHSCRGLVIWLPGRRAVFPLPDCFLESPFYARIHIVAVSNYETLCVVDEIELLVS